MNSFPENAYGHAKRLAWIEKYLRKEDKILEVGCGTGYMITLQLLKRGYDAIGIDNDRASIEYGRKIFQDHGFSPERLIFGELRDLDGTFDVIVASEILEHITETDFTPFLNTIITTLNDSGLLLVTVPNGYGWFEFESFLWYALGIGSFLERLCITRVISKAKHMVFGIDQSKTYPFSSTLSPSPHVQRFTLNAIKHKITQAGFSLVNAAGSVGFSGPFSDLLFTGFTNFMNINSFLGSKAPTLAAGFYLACRREPLGSKA